MKRIILSFLLVGMLLPLMAQKQYATTVVEKKRIVTGIEEFSLPSQTIFGNALLWAVNEGPQGKEEIVDIDFGKERLSMVYNLKRDGDDDPAYVCRLQLQVTENQVVFTVKDVKMHGGLKSMFSNFDKLNPEKKTKHADIIREFERLNDEKLNSLFNFIREHQLQVTNWDNIRSNSLQRGMSEDEVMLIYGKPASKQSDGTTTQYLFSSFVRVFIENGKVKSFVN
jgi:hypothetical protein